MLGDEQGVEPPLLDRAPGWGGRDALVGDERRRTELHNSSLGFQVLGGTGARAREAAGPHSREAAALSRYPDRLRPNNSYSRKGEASARVVARPRSSPYPWDKMKAKFKGK
ncbi:hypothetical protein SAMN05428940_0160 [Streptomyces sp. 2133.1]|nr:hypothetical protein BX261_0160 [Streptomyces sp. 2321.6]SEB70887.1 hypothetical protein SAMN05428940_0160 [Streptomyces sp. 2133.1]SNC59921.1 hypothetical protein SAMN06272741_0162 [Streptomyces sp. 2114.4]